VEICDIFLKANEAEELQHRRKKLLLTDRNASKGVTKEKARKGTSTQIKDEDEICKGMLYVVKIQRRKHQAFLLTRFCCEFIG
jgi:hypothetical protein